MDSRLRNCGVPCYVKNGKVHLENEYRVCNKGELLDEKKAKILRFIGHKLVYLTINVIDQIETK
ncbi:mRNA turnover and ribosome assembly protein [Conglomerata obtusa]